MHCTPRIPANMKSLAMSSALRKIRDGPLENLWGGRGASTKIFVQEKIKWKKILARQVTRKNIHALA